MHKLNNCYSASQCPHDFNQAYLDSTATDHYGNLAAPLTNIQPINKADLIFLPNGDSVVASYAGHLLNLPDISSKGLTTQIFPTTTTLISMGKLCDDGCHVITNKDESIACRRKNLIMKAICAKQTGIHAVNLANPLQSRQEVKTSKINASISTTHGKENKVINIHDFTSLGRLYFLHGALGSPVKSKLIEAMRAGYLTSWPELAIENINNIDNPDHTIFGHMDQKRKNAQSTRAKEEAEDRKMTLDSHVPNKTNVFMHSIPKFNDTICIDQTGKFTCGLKRGHYCIFLTHCYDANSILV